MAATRVLVVDDDPDIGQFIATVLADDGFDAVVAADGNRAIELLAGEPFNVLVTDVRMPGLDGIQLAARARELSPGIRIVFMSGYTAEHYIDLSREDLIEKPFRPQELLACMRRILGPDAAPVPRKG
jgi:two-component system response regulator HydG